MSNFREKLMKLIQQNPDVEIIVVVGDSERCKRCKCFREINKKCDLQCNFIERATFNDTYFYSEIELVEYIAERVICNFDPYDYETPEEAAVEYEKLKENAKEYIKENNITFEKYIQICVG